MQNQQIHPAAKKCCGWEEPAIYVKISLFFVFENRFLIFRITRFFQDFFFEAVVTVNLTTMLVLTTMFISVSNNLPTTAYVKMIDVWLIFNLLMPFILVLLHTYMDSLRIDKKEEGEVRTINHHGKAIIVGEDILTKPIKVAPANNQERNSDLIHRNEILELEVSIYTQKSKNIMFLKKS